MGIEKGSRRGDMFVWISCQRQSRLLSVGYLHNQVTRSFGNQACRACNARAVKQKIPLKKRIQHEH